MATLTVKQNTFFSLFLYHFISFEACNKVQGEQLNEELGYRKVWVTSESLTDGYLSDPVIMG